MKSLLSKSIVASLFLSVAACGPALDNAIDLGPNGPFASQHSEAPKNQMQADSEIGIYGLSEGELISALSENPDLQYRQVNKAHGLYTLKGVSEAQAQQLFPGRITMKNDFEQNHAVDFGKSPQLLARELLQSATLHDFAIKREKLTAAILTIQKNRQLIWSLAIATLILTRNCNNSKSVKLLNSMPTAHRHTPIMNQI
jgi:hypothetical protein